MLPTLAWESHNRLCLINRDLKHVVLQYLTGNARLIQEVQDEARGLVKFLLIDLRNSQPLAGNPFLRLAVVYGNGPNARVLALDNTPSRSCCENGTSGNVGRRLAVRTCEGKKEEPDTEPPENFERFY